MRPEVSVVLCSYNPEANFFREAIESVLAQTFPGWELLIVDNGTSNGNNSVAHEYAEKFPQIYYCEHPHRENKGPAASRNLGVRLAKGTWVAFIDSDDYWLPEKLQNQVAAMRAHPRAVLSFGGLLRWYSWAGKDAVAPDRIELHAEVLTILPPPELVRRLLQNQNIPGMSALMVQKAALEKVGGFEESLLWAEDQTISYKLGLLQDCLLLPGWEVKYRQHPSSTTWGVEASGSELKEHLKFLGWIGSYFEKAQMKDRGLWQKLRKLQRQYRLFWWQQKLLPAPIRKCVRWFRL